jgi:Sap, sulfolipid-1-addressing protein
LTVGLVVLFVFRRWLPALSAISQGPTRLTLPKVQILIGVLALLAAAVLVMRVVLSRFSRRHPAEAPVAAVAPGRLRTRTRTRTKRLLSGRSPWVAAAAGLGIALPSVDYLAVLVVILASGAAAMTQVAALLVFNVVAFALVEIPLVAYLLAPTKTQVSMAALNDWVRTRRRLEVAILLAAVGCLLLAVAAAGL